MICTVKDNPRIFLQLENNLNRHWEVKFWKRKNEARDINFLEIADYIEEQNNGSTNNTELRYLCTIPA